MRKQLVSGKKLLLFVDTGDNCRCPLAIGYLSKLLAEANIDYIELRHMGVMTPNDLLPTPEVVQLLKEEGVDIRYHRSRPVNPDLIREADLVLGFTAIHVQTCLRRVPESKGKVHLLKQYVGLGHTGDQIHDPMGSTMEIFKKYFNEIKAALHKLMETEFIQEPPEPQEMVIAPSISRPKSMTEEEEPVAPKSRGRKAAADADEAPARPRKSRAAAAEEADEDEKPAAKKKSASSTAGTKKTTKATKNKAAADEPEAAEAKPKKSAAKTSKASKSAAASKDESDEKKTAAKPKKTAAAAKVKVSAASGKKADSAPKVAAVKKAATAEKKAAPKAKAAKAPAEKASAAKKPAAAKSTAKTAKSKK